jgi:hypothetical protein
MDLHNLHRYIQIAGSMAPLQTNRKVDMNNQRTSDIDLSKSLQDIAQHLKPEEEGYVPDVKGQLLFDELQRRIDMLAKYRADREQPHLQTPNRTMPLDTLRRLGQEQSIKQELNYMNQYHINEAAYAKKKNPERAGGIITPVYFELNPYDPKKRPQPPYRTSVHRLYNHDDYVQMHGGQELLPFNPFGPAYAKKKKPKY